MGIFSIAYNFFMNKDGVNWTKILLMVCIGLLIVCIWLTSSKAVLKSEYEKNFSILSLQYEELKHAFDAQEIALKNASDSVESLKTRASALADAYDNSVEVLQKKYKLCMSQPKTMAKEPAIKSGEIIDDKSSEVYIDIFNNNIFTNRVRK